MSRLAAVVVLFVSASASADTAYVDVGTLEGIGEPMLHFAVRGEAGVFIPRTPLVLYAGGMLGRGFDFEGGGPISRGVGGLDVLVELGESRSFGLVGGGFAGYQKRTWEGQDDPTEHYEGLVVGARTGFDITPMRKLDAWTRNLRIRVLAQVEHFQQDKGVSGVEISTGIGYTF